MAGRRLRFTNPVNHATDRFTTEDLPIGDVVIPAGEWVFIATSSANRNPAQFPDPDRLDLARDTSGHVAFGYGIHYCLGAPPARMEAEVALGAVLGRFPGLSLAVPPEELRWRPTVLMNARSPSPSASPDPGNLSLGAGETGWPPDTAAVNVLPHGEPGFPKRPVHRGSRGGTSRGLAPGTS